MANGDVTNGNLGKLQSYLVLVKDIWNTFGLPTIILVVLLLLWIGTIPSPLVEAEQVVEGIKASLDRHVERDDQIIFYLREMCLSNMKLAGDSGSRCLWPDHEH